jgi:hypothetical protein
MVVVQFKRNHHKTNMTTKKSHLDGSEQSMIPILKHDVNVFSFGTKQKMIPIEEFSAGTGISDLTIFTIDRNILEKRKHIDQKPITARNQIRTLTALLETDTATFEEIVKRTKLNKVTVKNILSTFTENGIVFNNNGQYKASYTISRASTDNIIAIEAKVRDWKSGLKQAMRYKEYADFSYLAIYEANIASCLKNINIFEQLGIGLLGVSDEGVKIHLAAQKTTITNFESRILAFERMISVIDGRHESYIARNGFASN